MSYIIPADYLPLINEANLLQVINSDEELRKRAEEMAQAEAVSYLKQKFDTTKEIINTTKWDKTAPYSAFDRVYLDAPAYDSSKSYSVGEMAVFSRKVYSCNSATTGTWDESKWDLVGGQYYIYYALPPYSLFDLYAVYEVGDNVFYNGKMYQCLVATPLLDHETGLQYRVTQNLPYQNVFPDDKQQGDVYWKDNGAYLVPANTDINNEAFWSDTDNRDQQLVQKFVEITLFHLHKRIAPRNVPQSRIDAYMGAEQDRAVVNGEIRYPVYSALGWLQACGRGEITPNLPLFQPRKGQRIRWGGNIKNINSYVIFCIFGLWKITAMYINI